MSSLHVQANDLERFVPTLKTFSPTLNRKKTSDNDRYQISEDKQILEIIPTQTAVSQARTDTDI